MAPERFQIVLVLNEYGDFLSDMACGLAGSLGIGASANLGFDAAAVVRVAHFDAAHGTAPDIAGKNLANPTAIFLALALLLYQVGEIALAARSRRRRSTCCARVCGPATWAVKNRPRASPTPWPPRSRGGWSVRDRQGARAPAKEHAAGLTILLTLLRLSRVIYASSHGKPS